MKNKTFSTIIVSIILLASFIAPAFAFDGDSIAIMLSGPQNDNSWNEAAYNAGMSLKEKGVEVAIAESVESGNAERISRTYSDLGYKMIIGHSFDFGDPIFTVSEEYPETYYAWAGGINQGTENVSDYEQPFYEAAYPIGIIAAYVSKTGKLGAVYGTDIPVCHSMGEALLAGAKSVNPDIELISTAVGDWVDVAKAKEAALAQSDLGVDFWIECGEGPALGVIAAAQEVGGYATGYVGDMTENGPSVVLVNLIWNLEPMFTQMLKDVREGTFHGEYYRFGVAQDAMYFTLNESLKDVIPQEALDAANQAIEDIKSGKLAVEFIPE